MRKNLEMSRIYQITLGQIIDYFRYLHMREFEKNGSISELITFF